MYTGERQVAKMRLAYLRSMLNQDINLFNTKASTTGVVSAITSDIIIVQDSISEEVLSVKPIHLPVNGGRCSVILRTSIKSYFILTIQMCKDSDVRIIVSPRHTLHIHPIM